MKTIAQCVVCGCDFEKKFKINVICPEIKCKKAHKKKMLKSYAGDRRKAYGMPDTATPGVNMKNKFLLGLT